MHACVLKAVYVVVSALYMLFACVVFVRSGFAFV